MTERMVKNSDQVQEYLAISYTQYSFNNFQKFPMEIRE